MVTKKFLEPNILKKLLPEIILKNLVKNHIHKLMNIKTYLKTRNGLKEGRIKGVKLLRLDMDVNIHHK